MVTIEQKLLLFSKLLNQSMDKKFEEELKEMNKQYKEKIVKNKEEVDNEVVQIEEKAKIAAELKRTQSMSKSRVSIKKEIMSLNEKYYNIFIGKFKDTLNEFVKSDKYENYLNKTISKFSSEILKNNDIESMIIYLNDKDYKNYSEFIKKEILKKQSNINIVFKTTNTILGGFIAENTVNNFKVTMTIDAVLEDNKLYIMQTLFEALEAGVYNG